MHLRSFFPNFVGQLQLLQQTPTGPSNGTRWFSGFCTAMLGKGGSMDLHHFPQPSTLQLFFAVAKCLRQFDAIWMYSVIRGMLRWQTSHHPQSTFRASRRSFPKVMQINCGGFAPYKLDQSTSINAIFRAKNFEPLCGESRVESHPLAQRQPLKGARKQQQLL